ncbi:rps24e [Ecytonucleospora hepatopenaei]|uniref:Rps24e n=1 Tax=Ecytonucleospora hepatopenaei TaxID=646526 RepID=A0A1W0E9A1_9MICR|nr:rps24e [Ecytonucleospora hepatopenaei]
MALQLKVTKSFANCIFNRKEIDLSIRHSKQATPNRETIRKELSTNYSIPVEQIRVFDMKTGFGINETMAKAHLYSDVALMKSTVLPYVLKKITGEEKTKIARKQRKDARKKRVKIFGTMARNMRKAAKRSEN